MDRITKKQLHERCTNVNRRLRAAGSGRAVNVQDRSGYTALDEYDVSKHVAFSICVRTITVGTKREIGEYLNAMMIALDLASVRD